MTANHLRYWLAAIYLPEIGPRRMLRWLERFNDIEKFFHASQEELRAAGLNAMQINAVNQPDWESVDRDLVWAEAPHHYLLTYTDENYPPRLKEIPDPPLVLYVSGNLAALNHIQIALVGSRHPTPCGAQDAFQFAYHLASSGFTITSGLALGIDGASHRGALKAKGVTVGVAGTGLNHLYPAANKKLAEEMMAAQGAVISEFPLAMRPLAANFPRRNRIISGLSVGVLVVEAAVKSGSLITARHALEQNREVFAIPGSIHNPLARGCHHLIRQGAKLVETAQDIIDELDPILGRGGNLSLNFAPENEQSINKAPDPHAGVIFDQVGYSATSIDMIILRSRLTSAEVSSILLKLELQGYIKSVTGGYIRAVPQTVE